MAAPTLVQSSTGTIITGISGDLTSMAGVTVGNVILIHVLEDGTTGGIGLVDTNTSIANLAGTGNTMTNVLFPQVGSPSAAAHGVWIGRATATTVSITVNTGDDLYGRMYEFANVNTGTTLADVIENATAGTATSAVGTGVTVSDVAVVTLGPDRLAINLVGINDDATTIGAFVGMTGGTWAMPASFESATGTDGTISLMTATMTSAGTIDGGSDTITSDGWGVIGFALIGTTSAAAPGSSFQTRRQRRASRYLTFR